MSDSSSEKCTKEENFFPSSPKSHVWSRSPSTHRVWTETATPTRSDVEHRTVSDTYVG